MSIQELIKATQLCDNMAAELQTNVDLNEPSQVRAAITRANNIGKEAEVSLLNLMELENVQNLLTRTIVLCFRLQRRITFLLARTPE